MRRLNSTFGNRSKKNKVPIYLVGMGNLGRLELELSARKSAKLSSEVSDDCDALRENKVVEIHVVGIV